MYSRPICLLSVFSLLAFSVVPAIALDTNLDGLDDAVRGGPTILPAADGPLAVVDTGDQSVDNFVDRLTSLGYTVTTIPPTSGYATLTLYDIVILPVAHAGPAHYATFAGLAADYIAYVADGGALWVSQPNPYGMPGNEADIVWVPYALRVSSSYDNTSCDRVIVDPNHCITTGLLPSDLPYPGDTVLSLGAEWEVLIVNATLGDPGVLSAQYGNGRVMVEFGHPHPGAVCAYTDEGMDRMASCLLPSNPGDLLYDVDYDTPPHIVGAPPVVGTGPAPRRTPTSIWFGDPTVVASLGALTDQPCRFGNGTTGYDQLEFITRGGSASGFPIAYDIYHVEMLGLVTNLSGATSNDFTVLVDIPSAYSVRFRPDGTIYAYPNAGVIGTYTIGTPFLLEIDVDVVGDTWSISVDGSQLHAAPASADELRAVRVNLAGQYATDAAAMDEFKVYGLGGPAPEAVCCFNDYSCQIMTEELCTTAGGMWHPEWTSCTPNPCLPSEVPFSESNTSALRLSASPNPLMGQTTISFHLASPAEIRLEIFDLSGRCLTTLLDESVGAGDGTVVWNGRDRRGAAVAPGAYFIRLTQAEAMRVERLVVVR